MSVCVCVCVFNDWDERKIPALKRVKNVLTLKKKGPCLKSFGCSNGGWKNISIYGREISKEKKRNELMAIFTFRRLGQGLDLSGYHSDPSFYFFSGRVLLGWRIRSISSFSLSGGSEKST